MKNLLPCLLAWMMLGLAPFSAQPLLSAPAHSDASIAGPNNSGDPGDSAIRPSPAESSSLRCEIYDGYLLVATGRMGSLENLHFAIDTGATNTIIDERIARSLSLPRYSAEALSIGKPMKVSFANLPELELGSLHAAHLRVVVSDLSFFRTFATRIDAIIGMDLLGRQNFTLDYAARRLILGHARPAPHEIFLRVGALLAVDLDAQNHPLRMIVDSGASGIILYHERLHRHAIVYSNLIPARSRGFTGMELGAVASLPRLHLAGAPIEPRVFIATDPAAAPGAVPDRDGYLGLSALNAKFISFDFAAAKMSWSD